MILTKKINICINVANIKHFEKLDYHNLKLKQKISIPVEHLMRGSNVRIKDIEEKKLNGNQLCPNYSKNSIPILESKAKELGITDLQHGENGGEYYIKELGYWVDGFSKEKNIVIEYDEKQHYSNGALRKKDIGRQKEIEEFLGCKFIRIKE